MFDGGDKKKNQIVKANETITTVIGQGVCIDGNTFKGVGTVRVDGVYMGEMFIDGHVIVGQSGEIRGNITANTMAVAGTVTGNIVCREELHITETAVTEGEIQTHLILVDQGASINGPLSTGKKTMLEPINLDDAVKNMQLGGRKSIEIFDDRNAFAPPAKKRLDEKMEDKTGFFAKEY